MAGAFDSESFDTEAFDEESFDFGELAGPGPVFDGPGISNLILLEDAAMSPLDYSGRFSGGAGALTFTLQGGAVPGLSLSSAGVLSGTPTTPGTYADRVVRASDGADTADSNAFTITVVTELPSGGAISGDAAHRLLRAVIRPPLRTLGSMR